MLDQLAQLERPTNAQFAIAAFFGIVVGALGGDFSRVLLLFLAIVATLGIWRAVTLLAVIAAQGEEQAPRPRYGAQPIDQTIPIHGGYRR
jgi:hypothetical protein